MHNSLSIRGLLARTNREPMRRARRDPHRLVAPDPKAQAGADEFSLAGAWRVTARLDDAATAALLEADLRDFLRKMGVALRSAARRAIVLSLAGDLGARDCRYVCEPEGIRIEAGGIAGLWAGVAWLECEMRTRRGPFLTRGEFVRRAAWPIQISQGPWGGNYSVPDFAPEYLSDDAFRLYAHYGVNAMMIYGDLLCYVKSAILPELNHPDYAAHIAMLRDAARRAARYGVRFSYVVVGPKLRADHSVFRAHPEVKGAGFDPHNTGLLHFLCSSSPRTLDFYEETFANLCHAVPELAGVVLILYSESLYHCRIWDDRVNAKCPRCADAEPHAVVAGVVERIRRGVRAAPTDAYVAAWIYTWQRGDRRDLFGRFDPGVGVWHHVEKDELYPRRGYKKNAWDYSVDCIGPTAEMRQLAEFARATGRPLFVKTETGTGLETFQFPYVPALQRLADKWQVVRDLRPWGVQQSWLFFGMFGSRAEELGFWAAYGDGIPRDEYLRRMAVRDFGPEAAGAALQAWAAMSAAIQHLPCTCLTTYYIGPSFLGPAHPLVPDKAAPIPDVFDGYLFYLQELEETFSVRQIEEAKTCLVMAELPEKFPAVQPDDPGADVWAIVAREYAAAATGAERAWRLLLAAGRRTRVQGDRIRLREETLLTELICRTFRACEHTVRFLMARREFERTGAARWRREMRAIACRERANALAALPIYRAAPWLDLQHRTDGTFRPCAEMIRAKVRWLDRFLGGII